MQSSRLVLWLTLSVTVLALTPPECQVYVVVGPYDDSRRASHGLSALGT
jgi:hypothetical protein